MKGVIIVVTQIRYMLRPIAHCKEGCDTRS
jgi:hypothetical protein